MSEKKPKRLTAKQKRMKRAIEYMENYMATYSDQYACIDYTDATFIDDILYGLGVALDEEYQFANGYDEFKKVLRKHLAE